jgi:hypothetical protein
VSTSFVEVEKLLREVSKVEKPQQSMLRLTKIIDKILGRTGVHLVDSKFSYIKKHIDPTNIPREQDVVYFGTENYEVAKVLHNYENYRHTTLVVIVPKPHKVIADAVITFPKKDDN